MKLNQNQIETLTAVFAAARTSWRDKNANTASQCMRHARSEMMRESYEVEAIIFEHMVGERTGEVLECSVCLVKHMEQERCPGCGNPAEWSRVITEVAS